MVESLQEMPKICCFVYKCNFHNFYHWTFVALIEDKKQRQDKPFIQPSDVFSALLKTMPEHIYNPITAMEFLAMFTFQLNNTKR